jgi:hypothetical protein
MLEGVVKCLLRFTIEVCHVVVANELLKRGADEAPFDVHVLAATRTVNPPGVNEVPISPMALPAELPTHRCSPACKSYK